MQNHSETMTISRGVRVVAAAPALAPTTKFLLIASCDRVHQQTANYRHDIWKRFSTVRVLVARNL